MILLHTNFQIYKIKKISIHLSIYPSIYVSIYLNMIRDIRIPVARYGYLISIKRVYIRIYIAHATYIRIYVYIYIYIYIYMYVRT